MPSHPISPLDKVLGRLDDLDSVNLTILVQRLARERRLLEMVFNAIKEGILVVNPSGLIEYSNMAAQQLLGLKPADVGKAVLWRLAPDLARSLNIDPKHNLEASTAISREIEIHYPEHRYIRLYLVPFDQGDAKVETLRFALILGDVTEDKVSTEQRIESEKLASIFMLAAGVAHELGNPLNSLTIHLQLIENQLKKLKATGRAADKLSESLQICLSEVARLDGIIQNFLEAIRPKPLDLQEVNPISVLKEVLRVQAEELKNLDIRVDIALKGSPPVIMADRNQLKQVFFNLIKNAMEAMREGGRLKIHTRSDDAFVYLILADSGSGIPQEDLSRIFQPYFTTKKGGTGLGMMIVQRILRDHGAKIGIDSQAGVGTLVTLEFPQKNRRFHLLKDSS